MQNEPMVNRPSRRTFNRKAIQSLLTFSLLDTLRLSDVFVIGPLMMWGGMTLMRQHPLRGRVLAISGAATIFYNGYNYLRLRDQGYR